MKKIILLVIITSFFAISCKKEKEQTKTINDALSNSITDTLGKGTFVGVDHSLSGKAILLKDNSNNHILRLEKFNMTAAPDADVFLSKSNTYSAGNVIKISDLNQNTNYANSAINIEVAENINFTEYKYVIVWCTQYSAFFGHADLD